jgi:hypothetical protein
MMTVADRFMRHVIRADSGCWVWKAAKDRHGYGKFSLNKRAVGAHRACYLLFRGPIPKGSYVCHSCDNPACVNPAHLWIGTATANARDRDAKDRVQHGTGHYAAKLKPEDVAEIIKSSHALTQRELAGRFGVAQPTINAILSGKAWKRAVEGAVL